MEKHKVKQWLIDYRKYGIKLFELDFSFSSGAYEYWKKVQDRRGVDGFRDAITGDATAMSVVSALLLTISIPALMNISISIYDSDSSFYVFDGISISNAINLIFRTVAFVSFAVSTMMSFAVIWIGTFFYCHLLKIPNQDLLYAICCVKGRWYGEEIFYLVRSVRYLLYGVSASVYLQGGYFFFLVVIGIFLFFYQMSMRVDGGIHEAVCYMMNSKSDTEAQEKKEIAMNIANPLSHRILS